MMVVSSEGLGLQLLPSAGTILVIIYKKCAFLWIEESLFWYCETCCCVLPDADGSLSGITLR